MPFKKGTPRHKDAGRKPGAQNKRTLAVKELAEKMGVDPFEILLNFAKGDWKALGYDSPTVTVVTKQGPFECDVVSPDNRLKAASEVCQYISPKLKAIEHSVEDGAILPTVYRVRWADEDDQDSGSSNAEKDSASKKN